MCLCACVPRLVTSEECRVLCRPHRYYSWRRLRTGTCLKFLVVSTSIQQIARVSMAELCGFGGGGRVKKVMAELLGDAIVMYSRAEHIKK